MTYTEAVQLALDGNERGFGFLYQNTYKEKLYLALQYMKNQSDAEDVLQDAYVKAFSNLKDLKDPEKFSSWLGQIVANTAKNALVKKNPVLFTDLPADEEEEESYEKRIPDEDASTQPELSYTREETRQMVQEMIDSLSDEQRVCILMYHMEDMPIKEIAETLDCSESTVKSRLNYGRKNLKAKAEEMQKKGYKLYSIAPLALLLLLLHTDAKAMETEPSFQTAGRQVSNTVFKQIEPLTQGPASPQPEGTKAGPDAAAKTGENATGGIAEAGENAAGAGAAMETGEAGAVPEAGGVGAGAAGGTGEAGVGAGAAAGAGKAAAGAAARVGFFSTTAGKIVIGVIIAAVAGGAVVGILQYNRGGQEEEVVEEAPAASQEESAGETSETESAAAAEEEETGIEAEPAEEEAEAVVSVTEEMYPDLLESGSTKSQFEKLLGYVPVGMTDGQVSNSEVAGILANIGWDCFLRFDDSSESYIGVEGSFREINDTDDAAFHGYFDFNLEQMNNYLSVLLSEPLTSSNLYKDNWVPAYDDTISGNTLSVVGWGGDYGLSQEASITDAVQSGDTMILNFSVTLFNSVEYTHESRNATLKQQDDGKYRIVSVSSGTVDLSNVDQQTDTVSSLTNLYIETLKGIQADQFEFEYAFGDILGYEYFLTDMDGDGVKDLVVGKLYNTGSETGTGVFNWYDCRVFSGQSRTDGWALKEISGEVDLLSAFLPSDGNGFIATTDFGRGTGDAEYHRITMEDGTLSVGESTQEEGTLVEWYDIGNLSGLSGVD